LKYVVQLSGQRAEVVRWNHILRWKQFRNSAHGGADARQPTCHRLNHCPRNAFLPGWKHEQVGAIQFRHDRLAGGYLSAEIADAADAELARHLLQRRAVLAVTDQHQSKIVALPHALSYGADEHVLRFIELLHTADADQSQRNLRAVAWCSRRRQIRLAQADA
jgi:hypothetical protein